MVDTVANDTGTTATLAVGGTVNGVIDQNDFDGDTTDRDYYRVTLTGGHRYTFSANANISFADTLDAVAIRLRDVNGNIMSPDPIDDGATPSFTFDMPGSGSATYYLAVSAGGAGAFADKTGSFSASLADNGVIGPVDTVASDTGMTVTPAVGGAAKGMIEQNDPERQHLRCRVLPSHVDRQPPLHLEGQRQLRRHHLH